MLVRRLPWSIGILLGSIHLQQRDLQVHHQGCLEPQIVMQNVRH